MDLGSGLAIAGWFVKVIGEKCLSLALQAWATRSGYQDGVEKMRVALMKVQTMLPAAEEVCAVHSARAEQLVNWVKELKDAAYEADDLLDELDYLRLCEQVEGGSKSQVSRLISSKLKALKTGDCLSRNKCRNYMCFCGATTDQESRSTPAAGRGAMAAKPPLNILDQSPQQIRTKISQIVERLNLVADGAFQAIQVRKLVEDGPKQREIRGERLTTSLLAGQDKVYGREEERHMIIELLLKPADNRSTSSRAATVCVLPLVGIGGVGKTTLAQLVYHDERISRYFEQRIWICVSDNFDLMRLTREILEAVSGGGEKQYGGITNLDALQEMLAKKLLSKRFLLVLDDTWNDKDKKKWETLYASLKSSKEGSKILVTTRLGTVARMMGTMEAIEVKGLEDDDYWSLFKACSFGNEEPNAAHSKLAKIGKHIASKLRGSPLAAKTLGSLLKDKPDVEHWTSILNSNIWELRQSPDDIMPVLRLSYEHLPVHVQQCFAYCSIFPKGYNYGRLFLTELWIAAGFIHSQNDSRRPEDVGQAHFDDLVSRSFFQRLEHDGGIYHVMHDLLHDLASSIAADECSRIEVAGSTEVPRTMRHLAIWNTGLAEVKHNLSMLKGLRTLLVVAPSVSNSDYIVLQEMMKENLRSLRVLHLYGFCIEKMTDTIDHLVHLRYLGFGNSCVKEFSDSLCRLYHLQFLVFSDCAHGSFPSGITNLINLRTLKTDDCEAICDIARFGKLTALQSLDEFCVRKARGYEIGQLKEMAELHGSLCIENLENVESKTEALEAGLKDKKHLRDLCLCWSSLERSSRPRIEEEVLEGLHPHPYLKKLEIISYAGARSSAWLVRNQYTNLESLHLIDCSKLKDLPPLGSLPSLKVLEIRGGRAMRKVSSDFYCSGEVRGFPSLEFLQLEDMPELEEWCDVEDSQLFPRLQKLQVKNCTKLMGLPRLPPSLKELHIQSVGLTAFPEWRNRSHEGTAASSCNDVNMIPSSSAAAAAAGLSFLYIDLCQELATLPWEGLRKLTSLRELRIKDCRKLEFVMPYVQEESGRLLLLPSSLVELRILWCRALTMPLSECLQGLTSLTKLDITGWQHITTLPSAEALHHLMALRELHIQDCRELTSIGGLRALASLEEIHIYNCPKLTSASPGLGSGPGQIEGKRDEGLSTLHSVNIDESLLLRLVLTEEGLASLRELHIERCNSPQLLFSSDGEDEVVLQCLTSLSHLLIIKCPRLTSLPSAELLNHLTALQELTIKDCPQLGSVGGLRALVSLKKLTVLGCPKLTTAVGEGTSTSLDFLAIDDPSLLKVLLLEQGLSSLQELGISRNPQLRPLTGEQLEAFYHLTSLQALAFFECANLLSLPADLKGLSSLKFLFIEDCPDIQSLPNQEGLPASLIEVVIINCNPVLKERYQFAEFPVPIAFE